MNSFQLKNYGLTGAVIEVDAPLASKGGKSLCLQP